MSLRALAASIRSGEVGAVEVVRARQALAAEHASLNVFTDVDWSAALEAAAVVDRRRAAGDPLGPLAGVPITVKDVIAVAGFGLTAGSRAFASHRASFTAPAVAQLMAAGAIVLGKTNCPEFAFNMTCSNELFGTTLNPLDASRSPGGSSGGEAAAVAAGISSLGVGTDFGGSVRWPAQCTGIVALRPSLGRVSGDGQVPGLGGSMGSDGYVWANPNTLQGQSQVIGPMARTVDDLVLALGVMQAGSSGAGVPPDSLRIGWSDGRHIGPVRNEVVAAISVAASRVGAEGLGPVFADCLPAYNHLRALDPMHDHVRAVRGRESLVGESALATFQASFTGTPDELADAWQAALAARATALKVFEQVDVVLLPVAGGPACRPDGSLTVDEVTLTGWDVMTHLRAVTLTGAPTVSVPIGTSAEGLPISVQVVAAPGRDELALQVAAALEA